MISNLSTYLVSLDEGFGAAFRETKDAEKRLRPANGISAVEPSRREVAVSQTEGVSHVAALSDLTGTAAANYLARNPGAVSAIKAASYDHAHTYNQLAQFIWTKRSAVADGIAAINLCIDNGLFLAALTQLRATMEQVAVLVFVERQASGLVEDGASVQEQSRAQVAFSSVLFKSLLATRIDWEHYRSSPMKGGKRKGYKSPEEFQSAMAETVLDAIDCLDKSVKGARRAYEFLCEFSHPNAGTYFAYRSGKSVVQRNDSEFTFVETVLDTSTPSDTIEGFKEPLLGTFSLFVDMLSTFEEAVASLETLADGIKESNKQKARLGLGNWAPVWRAGEPCPCLSGIQVSRCCGKGLVK